MNEPNADHQSNSQPVNKMSSRATNFLMMGATKSAQQTQSLDPQDLPQEVNAHEASDAPGHYPDPPPQTQAEPAQEPKRTGVISSTIHPAQRPGMPPPEPPPPAPGRQAQPTSRLDEPAPEPAQRKPSREERIDKLAEHITDVLKKISDIKTGMLNPDLPPEQRASILSEKSPALSKFLTLLVVQLEPVFLLIQRINQKLVEKNLVQPKVEEKPVEEPEENKPIRKASY